MRYIDSRKTDYEPRKTFEKIENVSTSNKK